jgi:hypothetical protein
MHPLGGLSRVRKAVALRAVTMAHQLLVAGERVLYPEASPKEVEVVTQFVNRVLASMRKRDTKKGDALGREAELYAISCISQCAESNGPFEPDHELEVAMIKMWTFFPELKPDRQLLIDAVNAWSNTSPRVTENDEPNRWEAVCGFLRMTNTPSARARLKRYWNNHRRKKKNAPPTVESGFLEALRTRSVVGLPERPRRALPSTPAAPRGAQSAQPRPSHNVPHG